MLGIGFRSVVAVASLVLALSGRAPEAATVPTISPDGVKNLTVGSQLFDVSFVGGDCIEVFGSCEDVGEFDFSDFASAQEAAEALAFAFNSTGNYYDFYSPTGCSSSCFIRIPFGLVFTPNPDNPAYPFIEVLYWQVSDDGGFLQWLTADEQDFIGSFAQNRPYARFTPVENPVAAVPLPASGLLMIAGFAGLAAVRRRKLRTA